MKRDFELVAEMVCAETQTIDTDGKAHIVDIVDNPNTNITPKPKETFNDSPMVTDLKAQKLLKQAYLENTGKKTATQAEIELYYTSLAKAKFALPKMETKGQWQTDQEFWENYFEVKEKQEQMTYKIYAKAMAEELKAKQNVMAPSSKK